MDYSRLSRARRWSQILFSVLFVVLLLPARTVSIFLQADPLAAISNALATRALYRGLLWSLAVLIPTLFLGRVFCGWVCPLGSLNHFFSRGRARRRIAANRYQRWQSLKYPLLIAALAAAALGSGIFALLDPIALAVRSFSLAVLPAVNYALDAAPLVSVAASLKQPHFRQGFFLGLLLIALLAMNLRFTRFWCRALCPLGALLGLVSRWSLLRLEKRSQNCGDCNRCLLDCQGGDDPVPGARWRQPECHVCFNCAAACPEGALAFRFTAAKPDRPDLRRRHALVGLAAGAAAVPLLRAGAEPGRPIRPPGALGEPAFLERCIRCGACMRVCPNHALQPALALEGLWTPELAARIGYCEAACVLCGEACPTGAIRRITSREKGWTGGSASPLRIGTAFYDRGRCLPWAMATECIVCEEWCPTSPKAIYLRPAEAVDSGGTARPVRQPYVDPARCVGCGACEYACPVRERPAIYVTSAGESRSPRNQLLLAPLRAALLPESGDAPGWTRSGPARSFDASNLWQYIDGGAEKYIQAGVVRTLTAPYRYATTDAVADVYVMSSAGGARQVFRSEPAAGSHGVVIGDEGRLYGRVLTFHQGPYFVRLMAYEDAPLETLARAMEARLRQ